MIGQHWDADIVLHVARFYLWGVRWSVVFMVQAFFLFFHHSWEIQCRMTTACLQTLDVWKPPTIITQQPTSNPQNILNSRAFSTLDRRASMSSRMVLEAAGWIFMITWMVVCLFQRVIFAYYNTNNYWIIGGSSARIRFILFGQCKKECLFFSWFTWCWKKSLEPPWPCKPL